MTKRGALHIRSFAVGLLAAMLALTALFVLLHPDLLLAASISARLGAMVVALACYRRWQDLRLMPLAAMFLLMACRQLLALLLRADILAPSPAIKTLVELPGYVVTLLAFASIVYLWRLFDGRDQVERALQRELSMYRPSVESAPVGIWRTNGQGALLYANAEWSRITGTAARVGDDWTSHMLVEGTSLTEAAWVERVSQAPLTTARYTFRRSDGKDVSAIALVVKHTSADGAVMGFLGTLTDTTELKDARLENLRLERQILHAQKLESVGVLAGGIAHDFNNIMMSVIGNVDMLEDSIGPDDEAQECLDDLRHAAERASDLANQMLAYSGKSTLTIRPFDFREAVFEMQKLLRVSLSKKTTLRLHMDETTPPVRGDVTQIRQVVMNLITNAADAIGENTGVVELEVGLREFAKSFLQSCVVCDESLHGEVVFLRVTDDGAGMDAELAAKIFDPFFTTKQAGRGLGMSATLGIVRSHGGAIHLDSKPGEGTTFTVLLPPCSEPVQPVGDVRAANPDVANKPSILVVDDEPTVATVTKRILTKRGFEVHLARDGHEAVKVYQSEQSAIAAVILDTMMPGMNGFETLEKLRAIDSQVSVVLVSGFNEESLAAVQTTEHNTLFLQKPYGIPELMEAIDRCTSSDDVPAD